MRSAFIAAAALALAPWATAAAQTATAEIVDREGQPVGTATLEESPHGVLITVEAEGLPPGPHAIHIHAVGTCADAAEGFKASGGHINPEERAHGLMNPEGPDAGDLPNVFVGEGGALQAQMFTSRASLTGAEGRATILDEDGAALVMHENPDDHMTQPIGGAGARIACAAVTAAQ